MKINKHITFTGIIFCFISLNFVFAQEIYHMHKMWPVLEPPYYFHKPQDFGMDQNKAFYVVDSLNYRIQKFSFSGEYIMHWKHYDKSLPWSIETDLDNTIYIASKKTTDDSKASIIKYDPYGKFIQWENEEIIKDFQEKHESYSSFSNSFPRFLISKKEIIYVAYNDSILTYNKQGKKIDSNLSTIKFNNISGISVFTDSNKNEDIIYMIDDLIEGNITKKCIYIIYEKQQISSLDDLTSFEIDPTIAEGSNPGIAEIAIGVNNQYLFMTDYSNHQIIRYDIDSKFFFAWGKKGNEEGQFKEPQGVYTKVYDELFVVDRNNNRIQRFTYNGEFLSNIGMKFDEGYFNEPDGIAKDKAGNIYVADTLNKRIQIFDKNDMFVDQLYNDYKILNLYIDQDDSIYAVNENINKNNIIRYSPSGEKKVWSSELFKDPHDIDKNLTDDIFYIANRGSNNILQCDLSKEAQTLECKIFEYITIAPDESCEIIAPTGLAVGLNNEIYVASYGNGIVFKIENNICSEFIRNSEEPYEVELDSQGNIYVVYPDSHQIVKYNASGEEVAIISNISEYKSLQSPADCVITKNNEVYIVDYGNSRIQVYKQQEKSNNKAIIIMGGGPYKDNRIWDATQLCGHYADRGLERHHFSNNENLTILSAGSDIHRQDIKTIPATIHNVTQTILNADQSDNLIIYLVDHGASEFFVLSKTQSETLPTGESDSNTVTLTSTFLSNILDQIHIKEKILIIYDACVSRSFTDNLAGYNRIIITSAREEAYFNGVGVLSFSYNFWRNIFNGTINLTKAFYEAKELTLKISNHFQQPEMIPSDASFNFESAMNTTEYNKPPEIKFLSYSDDKILSATISDDDGIDRVYFRIIPSNYQRGAANAPVQDFPYGLMTPDSENPDTYKVLYTNPYKQNTNHYVYVHAFDKKGNFSISETILIDNIAPSNKKAILLAGTKETIIYKNIQMTINTLISQGYSHTDISILTPDFEGFENTFYPSVSKFEELLNACNSNTLELVLFMSGSVYENDGSWNFLLSDKENKEWISTQKLDSILDNITITMDGEIYIVIDTDYSGHFIHQLQNNKRTLIATTTREDPLSYKVNLHECNKADLTDLFSDESDTYSINASRIFTRLFWREIWHGTNVRNAFYTARNTIAECNPHLSNTIQIDDNGNGIGNEQIDGLRSSDHKIGIGIMADIGDLPGTIYGYIKDYDGNPIENATISTNLMAIKKSSENGFYYLMHEACQNLLVTASTDSETKTEMISIKENEEKELSFELKGNGNNDDDDDNDNQYAINDDIKNASCFVSVLLF